MEPLTDPLIAELPRDIQTQAARLAQDGFTHAFRMTLETPAAERPQLITEAADKLDAWVRKSAGKPQSILRLALLLSGLDQWGIAYSQLFGSAAMSGLSALLTRLRECSDIEQDELFAASRRINDQAVSAFSFKAALWKSIHLALWHSMIAEEDRAGATAMLRQLGGMMLSLPESMPELGWIIVANTLADIQIRCLSHGLAAAGLGQEMTQQLFAALNEQLAPEQRQKIMSGATQTVIAWQQSLRSTSTH